MALAVEWRLSVLCRTESCAVKIACRRELCAGDVLGNDRWLSVYISALRRYLKVEVAD
jgi:hypothetical protein